MRTAEKTLDQALREVPLLTDLPDEAIGWLMANGDEVRYEAGTVAAEQGDPAEYMFILLEGEIEARSSSQAPFLARAPQITGLLPHSRMKTMQRTVRTVEPTRLLRIHKNRFDEMMDRIPELEKRLIGLMADRIRDTAQADLQHEKLTALGKLAAGLAHELNNPAAAVARNIKTLREKLRGLAAGEEAMVEARGESPKNALERSDREEELGEWLSSQGIADAWELAAELVDAGFTRESASVANPAALRKAAVATAIDRLAADIEHASARISELVKSVKEYSYMDTEAETEVDIHAGIENTLTMLSHRLRGIQVERDFDPALKRVCGHGGELNQVWTNLIDNAADAMAGSAEKRLWIRTAQRNESAIVEVADTGAGIPDAIRSRIFEPFYTTKPQGQGTGLGLDIVFRIVKKHCGEIRFESKPGATCFQVTLPTERSRK